MDKKVISTNRKAFHEYHIFDKFVAGIVLMGTEIKSIRKGMLNLKDSYAKIEDGEVFIYSMHISPYEQGNRYNHKPERVRKLLLNKEEILKIKKKIELDRLTIVPTKAYFSGSNVKVEIAIARGKKLYDKRETIKQRDIEKRLR